MLFNKSIGAVVISFRDITERIKAEEKLALSALIVNSSDDAIIGMTMDKTINSWNPGAEKIFGYTSNEVIGKPIQLIIPPNLNYEERIISENIGHGKPVSHFETGRIGKDGKIINVSITISPITDESGEVIGLSKIIRDISFSSTEQRFRTVFLHYFP
jgi:PAS domain S-box-containing protein